MEKVTRYCVEYAESQDSKCGTCGKQIPNKSLRCGKIELTSPKQKKKHGKHTWYHFKCFQVPELLTKLPIHLVRGYPQLREEDQDRVKKLLEQGPDATWAQVEAKSGKRKRQATDTTEASPKKRDTSAKSTEANGEEEDEKKENSESSEDEVDMTSALTAEDAKAEKSEQKNKKAKKAKKAKGANKGDGDEASSIITAIEKALKPITTGAKVSKRKGGKQEELDMAKLEALEKALDEMASLEAEEGPSKKVSKEEFKKHAKSQEKKEKKAKKGGKAKGEEKKGGKEKEGKEKAPQGKKGEKSGAKQPDAQSAKLTKAIEESRERSKQILQKLKKKGPKP
ncbi:uncharacterized protein VTP21DRAFT_914 [Calcarisporiella thermophila]|uniref:uncharacterized protein n=1 Tax=Calcarisporiella thermophila TaxID=911321 RepID=UPI0037435EA4